VNSRSAFRWSIAVALLLSIGWKVAIPPENASDLEKHLVEFFERNHFDVVVTDDATVRIIQASMASCRLQVTRPTSDGWNRNLVKHVTVGADRSFVVRRGKVYAEQHVPSAILEDLRSRFLLRLGIKSHMAPTIAVAANASCNAEQLPWAELEAIP
jgi:hypothetical protein